MLLCLDPPPHPSDGKSLMTAVNDAAVEVTPGDGVASAPPIAAAPPPVVNTTYGEHHATWATVIVSEGRHVARIRAAMKRKATTAIAHAAAPKIAGKRRTIKAFAKAARTTQKAQAVAQAARKRIDQLKRAAAPPKRFHSDRPQSGRKGDGPLGVHSRSAEMMEKRERHLAKEREKAIAESIKEATFAPVITQLAMDLPDRGTSTFDIEAEWLEKRSRHLEQLRRKYQAEEDEALARMRQQHVQMDPHSIKIVHAMTYVSPQQIDVERRRREEHLQQLTAQVDELVFARRSPSRPRKEVGGSHKQHEDPVAWRRLAHDAAARAREGAAAAEAQRRDEAEKAAEMARMTAKRVSSQNTAAHLRHMAEHELHTRDRRQRREEAQRERERQQLPFRPHLTKRSLAIAEHRRLQRDAQTTVVIVPEEAPPGDSNSRGRETPPLAGRPLSATHSGSGHSKRPSTAEGKPCTQPPSAFYTKSLQKRIHQDRRTTATRELLQKEREAECIFKPQLTRVSELIVSHSGRYSAADSLPFAQPTTASTKKSQPPEGNHDEAPPKSASPDPHRTSMRSDGGTHKATAAPPRHAPLRNSVSSTTPPAVTATKIRRTSSSPLNSALEEAEASLAVWRSLVV